MPKESPAKVIWDKNNTTRYNFKFNNHTDADIIKRLAKQSSIQGYIKRLIREDIARNPS